jgi:rSAM/selenodomain-associated transferase 1
MSTSRLAIFAKYWEPGQVKTRLAAGIGDQRAAAFHRAAIEILLERLAGSADERWLCCWPPDRQGAFQELAGDAWHARPQTGNDLGERIGNFFGQAFESGVERVVLLGSDSPNVPLRHIDRAFDLLEEHRLVLGPTEDRGYYLVGAYRKTPPIFSSMPWGTPNLWPATLRQLDAEGWQRGVDYEVIPTWYDIDTQDDLKRLHRELLVEAVRDEVLTRLREHVEAALDYKHSS